MEFHVPASWGDEKKTNNLCNSRSDSRWLSIIRGIDFTRSGDDRNSRLSDRREYRYVGRFNTTIAFLSTILFRVRARSMGNGKNAVDAAGRTPVSWTRSREGAAAAAGSVLSVNAGGFVWCFLPRVLDTARSYSTIGSFHGTRTVIGPFQQDRRCPWDDERRRRLLRGNDSFITLPCAISPVIRDYGDRVNNGLSWGPFFVIRCVCAVSGGANHVYSGDEVVSIGDNESRDRQLEIYNYLTIIPRWRD